jgi:transposase
VVVDRAVITAWKARHRSVSGHQGAYEMREIVNAIFYQGRTGCQWAYLPHDLPQKSATYYYFAAWRDDGTDQIIHEPLRCQVRERARRLEDPTLVVLDTQSVHVAAGVPAATTGRDPAKRVPGRKRDAGNGRGGGAAVGLLRHSGGARRSRPWVAGRQVAAEWGIATIDRSKVEGLRSKLKRLVARSWLDQRPSGVFTITE